MEIVKNNFKKIFKQTMRTKSAINNKICELCRKSFSTADNLKKHILIIHEGLKDYKCESCSKLFSQAGDLKRHIHIIHA